MPDPLTELPDGIKHALDALSFAATLGVLVQWLPALSALLSCVWLAIRILESDTVKGFIDRRNK